MPDLGRARLSGSQRPLLIYDGECAFCRAWIGRWRHIIGERIEFAPYQDAASRVPDIPRARFAQAVVLVEPDGRITSGAEAVYRSLATVPGRGWMLWLYRFLPGFAPASEWAYRLVARHRSALPRPRDPG